MRLLCRAVQTLLLATGAVAAALGNTQAPLLLKTTGEHQLSSYAPKLHGRFLHITDLHPDPHYRTGSDPDRKCHRGRGNSGYWGTEASSCDTPFSLVNETFRWIEENLRDKIDFVIWTGDSARHDNDVDIPRTSSEIYDLNREVIEKMTNVFYGGKVQVPVVPTLGNNDIYPHNIMQPGPNEITKEYSELWQQFIPEDQFHIFQRGAYFWTQVIPGRNGRGGLAVFSLNTLYFFGSNKAVDGCNTKSEPGYEQMDWLRIQLELMRQQGTKVILMGHVPPAWTSAKQNWDKTCWKKYVLWARQYRDIIVAHLFGHMNLDHFMLLDSDELAPPHLKGKKDKKGKKGRSKEVSSDVSDGVSTNDACYVAEFQPDDDPILSAASAESYLHSLRKAFQEMVVTPKENVDNNNKKKDKWRERYILALVGPSIVPNYFPTLRVIEYNTAGLVDGDEMSFESTVVAKPDKKKKKPGKGRKDPGPTPDPPAKTAPPGPAYSVQPYTLMRYTQYFLNLTKYNNLHDSEHDDCTTNHDLRKRGSSQAQFEVEYDTKTDKIYKLKDLTVRSYFKLARALVDARMTKTKETGISDPRTKVAEFDFDSEDSNSDFEDLDLDVAKKKKTKKRRKRTGNKEKDKIWRAFVRRAFVGTIESEDLETFEKKRDKCGRDMVT